MRAISEDDWPDRKTVLEKLEMADCDVYDWEPGQNRFSTAICPPGVSTWDQAYFEEGFSAWDIHIWPKFVNEDIPELEPEPAIPKADKGKGGAPRKWDWDGALLHLAALAHHGTNGLFREDGGDPNQSDIARHLQAWFVDTFRDSPENSQLRDYGKRFVTELNALKLKAAKNPDASG